jgi:aryl-alcohol dehydrogenase-like predicted oxidoreductase
LNYRTLGRSGLQVSEICLGTWLSLRRDAEEQSVRLLDTAVEHGVNFIDTADVYQDGEAERLIGRWLKGKDRRQIVLATKCSGRMWAGPNGEGASRKHIREAIRGSLRRLQVSYVDLYQIHGPDPETPMEETIAAMDDLITAGDLLYWGVSNFDASQVGACFEVASRERRHAPVSVQNRLNLLVRQSGRPLYENLGVGLLPYSPLAQGLLSDKYLGGIVPNGSRVAANPRLRARLLDLADRLDALAAFAHARKFTLSQLALAWVLHQPDVAAIVTGASCRSQLVENLASTGVRLSDAELKEIERLVGPGSLAQVHS